LTPGILICTIEEASPRLRGWRYLSSLPSLGTIIMRATIGVLIAGIAFFAGCSPSIEAVQDFKAGEVRTVNVGDAMITWGFNETNYLAGGKNYYQEHRSVLLYNGMDGKSIFIGYREFAGDLARAAFSTELNYPLGTKSIAYKERQVEVLEVDGGSIKFKVVK
jgi:hypothetical protein